jgi:hypoxanthine phosphoribosyltransferase
MENLKLIIDEDLIKQRIKKLGKEIVSSYERIDSPLICVCVLKGAILFFSDLIREMDLELEIDFVRLSSYGDATSPSEKVIFSKDMELSIKNRHVLIIEDIVDTGATIAYLKKVLEARNPLSVRVCALIYKTERRKLDVDIDFYGFKIEKGFLVGYGLDCAEKYRNLKGIYELINAD